MSRERVAKGIAKCEQPHQLNRNINEIRELINTRSGRSHVSDYRYPILSYPILSYRSFPRSDEGNISR